MKTVDCIPMSHNKNLTAEKNHSWQITGKYLSLAKQIYAKSNIFLKEIHWIEVQHTIASWFSHDDGIKWKHFPLYWPFEREFTDHRWIPVQRPVTRSFDGFIDMCLNKRLSKQSWGWWFETPPRSLWRHYNILGGTYVSIKLNLLCFWMAPCSFSCKS